MPSCRPSVGSGQPGKTLTLLASGSSPVVLSLLACLSSSVCEVRRTATATLQTLAQVDSSPFHPTIDRPWGSSVRRLEQGQARPGTRPARGVGGAAAQCPGGQLPCLHLQNHTEGSGRVCAVCSNAGACWSRAGRRNPPF
ncbi:uncharacterized protein ACWYII_024351 isoform 1-T1 [Salvelinus alpinus]